MIGIQLWQNAMDAHHIKPSDRYAMGACPTVRQHRERATPPALVLQMAAIPPRGTKTGRGFPVAESLVPYPGA